MPSTDALNSSVEFAFFLLRCFHALAQNFRLLRRAFAAFSGTDWYFLCLEHGQLGHVETENFFRDLECLMSYQLEEPSDNVLFRKKGFFSRVRSFFHKKSEDQVKFENEQADQCSQILLRQFGGLNELMGALRSSYETFEGTSFGKFFLKIAKDSREPQAMQFFQSVRTFLSFNMPFLTYTPPAQHQQSLALHHGFLPRPPKVRPPVAPTDPYEEIYETVATQDQLDLDSTSSAPISPVIRHLLPSSANQALLKPLPSSSNPALLKPLPSSSNQALLDPLPSSSTARPELLPDNQMQQSVMSTWSNEMMNSFYWWWYEHERNA